MRSTAIVLALVGLAACVDTAPLDGRACPCAPGWTCCPGEQLCVPDGDACPSAPDAGDDAPPFEMARLDVEGAELGDAFGTSVALAGDLAAVGAPGRDDDGADRGAVYLYERRGEGDGVWVRVAELISPDATARNGFGGAVAFLGDRLLVGANGGTGRVHVFRRVHGAWTLAQTIEPDVAGLPEANLHLLGFGTTILTDGDRAVLAPVGVPEYGGGWFELYAVDRARDELVRVVRRAAIPDEHRRAAAFRGDTVVTLTASFEDPARWHVDVYDDVAAGEAPTRFLDLPTPEGEGTQRTPPALAFDGARIAVGCVYGALCVLDRTEEGWSAPALATYDTAATNNVALALAWRGADELLAIRRKTSYAYYQRLTRGDDGWVADVANYLGVAPASEQALAASGDVIAIGAPGGSIGGQLCLLRPNLGEAWRSLDEGVVGRILAGSARHVLTGPEWAEQLFWFERGADGGYHRRPSLVIRSGRWIRAVALDGDTALAQSASTWFPETRTYDTTVHPFALADGDWTRGAPLPLPDDEELGNVGDTLALRGDVAVLAAVRLPSKEPLALVYRRGEDGWELTDRLAAGVGTGCVEPRAIVELDADAVLLRCFGSDVAHVFARTGDGWDHRPPPELSTETFWYAQTTARLSADRVAISTRLQEAPSGLANLFRWTGAAWERELDLRGDPVGTSSGIDEPAFGILAIAGDRLIATGGATTLLGYRWRDGAWAVERTFELPAATRSASAIVLRAALDDDRVTAAVPAELGRATESGAVYVYGWGK
jgi:hypothetical protein